MRQEGRPELIVPYFPLFDDPDPGFAADQTTARAQIPRFVLRMRRNRCGGVITQNPRPAPTLY